MKATKINKEFRIVFQPKDASKFNGNRRFAVGAGRLSEYIGKSNSEVVFEKAWRSTGDKIRMKFRANGIVDVYAR